MKKIVDQKNAEEKVVEDNEFNKVNKNEDVEEHKEKVDDITNEEIKDKKDNVEREKVPEEEQARSTNNLGDENEGTVERTAPEEMNTQNEEKGKVNEPVEEKKTIKRKKKLRKPKEELSRKENHSDISEGEGTNEKEEERKKEEVKEVEREQEREEDDEKEKKKTEKSVKDLKEMSLKKKQKKKKKKKTKNTVNDEGFIENEFLDDAAEEKSESESEDGKEKNADDGDFEFGEHFDELQNESIKDKTKSNIINKKRGENSKEISEPSELDFEGRRSDVEKNETNKLKKKKTHFDEILENIKLRKRKRQTMSDDECMQYCENVLRQMVSAHEQDIKAVKENKPATAKLHIVDNIAQILTKPKWKPYFMKLNINRVLEMWLMPLTKNSLPHFSIRSNMLKVIMQLPITIKSLRGSQLGKVLTYLHTHKDETEENKKMIKTILQNLLGPIIGINANYKHSLKKRQKKIMENPNFHKIILEKAKTLIPERISIEKEEEQNESKRHVTVPYNSECSFLINVPSAVSFDPKRNQSKNKLKKLSENFNFMNRMKKSQIISIDGKEITAAP